MGAGHPSGAEPLILTTMLPADLHGWATDLRTRHFPAERNHLKAHVTLFHALPHFLEAELITLLGRLAAEQAPVAARLEGIMSLGRGTALQLASPAMLALRDRIAAHLHGSLTAQDQHRPRLHVTVQNKVSPEDAKALQRQLAAQVRPRSFAFPGLSLHRYRGGPWDHVRDFRFRGTQRG
ncbi:2'-5' RNA ligase family protein [Erythrobacteraceae bacterium CFH 75059]|uniref:2'-5' RNA ligase family protein n=1 Tax=Qipengyuania thermophila TaxID=2509361 RepID=UPI00101F8FB8|nr:2'-5' RNA ligase family protein [Qipengyuania thermophila]TCD05047.1 2'-5' RNA ligase family protein [Erythrobacteraceae bacterium CFH 75059]